tara:strand:- start:2597 stop:4153 length:1557 start_codon:yes stop_codon:yes gene_type:complete
MEIFGFELSKAKPTDTKKSDATIVENIIPADEGDGAYIVGDGSWRTVYGAGDDKSGTHLSDNDLILRYRSAAEYPECDTAVNIIVDEAINTGNEFGAPVKLSIKDDKAFGEKTRKAITEKFEEILEISDFTHEAYSLFRRWYVDGRIYLLMIKHENDKKGLKDIRFIDPRKIRKIKEIKEVKDAATGVTYPKTIAEYFLYMSDDATLGAVHSLETSRGSVLTGVKLHTDSVIYVPSGHTDVTGKKVYSYMQKALKQVNQLRKLEDAVVIYRLARAPERRIFYVDVGNLSKGKADSLMKDVMGKYKNKMIYDASSGEVMNQQDHLSMMEDYWLPRREGGRGTEVSTLPGGENLGQIDDLIFFQRKLYRSLNVPLARLEQENTFSIGRSAEITREEVTLQKFIIKLQRQFSKIFIRAMKAHLVLTKVITEKEWDTLEPLLAIDFEQDNYFAELKEAELLEGRMNSLQSIDEFRGVHFSDKWIKNNVLRQSDTEIDEMKKEIEQEIKDGVYPDPNAPEEEE